MRVVSNIAKTTREPTALRSIALGAFAAGLFHPEYSGSKETLMVVRQRLKALGVAIESDPYLLSIFEKMGV